MGLTRFGRSWKSHEAGTQNPALPCENERRMSKTYENVLRDLQVLTTTTAASGQTIKKTTIALWHQVDVQENHARALTADRRLCRPEL
eukprot:8720-Eustigmatos_ZCMA.PRE.1